VQIPTQTPIAASPLEPIKDIAQIVSYLVGTAAAWLAWRTYRANSRRESAKWAVQLYEKFYEEESYREMREALDSDVGDITIEKLVQAESTKFTDYLNFFELVCFLGATNQIRESDVLTLFEYYFKCLKKHSAVVQYINRDEHGFERLKEFLPKVQV
jgi:hypothetical protein